MSYTLITENDVTRIAAHIAFSNGESTYVEVPVQEGDAEANYEQILIDRTLIQLKLWDDEGNEIPLGFTVDSVTAPTVMAPSEEIPAEGGE